MHVIHFSNSLQEEKFRYCCIIMSSFRTTSALYVTFYLKFRSRIRPTFFNKVFYSSSLLSFKVSVIFWEFKNVFEKVKWAHACVILISHTLHLFHANFVKFLAINSFRKEVTSYVWHSPRYACSIAINDSNMLTAEDVIKIVHQQQLYTFWVAG